jgi:hypothetical protein
VHGAEASQVRTGTLSARRGEAELELFARWLDCSPADGTAQPRYWLLTVAPSDGSQGGPLRSLCLDDGVTKLPLEPDALPLATHPASELASACRRRFDPPTCGRIGAFLGASPRAHNLEQRGATAAELRHLRQELRRADPVHTLELVTAPPPAELLDGALRVPSASGGARTYAGTYSIALSGWALAHDGAEVAIELRERSGLSRRTSAKLPSPEAALHHSDVPGAESCGFQFLVGTISLPLQFELEVDAVIGEDQRLPLGVVKGHRRPLRTSFEPTIQPLLVSTLGRTGSNWLLALLAQHPEIVAYRPFQSETRAAGYWMHVLRTVAEPGSYMQSILAQPYDEHWWIGDRRHTPLPLEYPETELPQWLGTENVEAFAGICQQRIDAFYRHVARTTRSSPRFFAEKAFPGFSPALLRELYPEAHELVLIRDLRDVACSILAYSAKRGLTLWGRGKATTDQEWVEFLRKRAIAMLDRWRARSRLVRYEDLIADPNATLAGIFSWLSLDASDATLAAVMDDATRVVPRAQEAHRTSDTIERSIGRWQRELSDELRQLFSTRLDDILVQFGYEPTSTD